MRICWWQHISSLAAIQRRGFAKHMKHRPPSWIVYLQGPHPRHRFQSPGLTSNNNTGRKKHKSISQQHHTTNTQAWKEASTNCTQLINLKTWLLAKKLTHSISLALISKHTGGQGSGSLRMLGEELNQQGSLCSLHTQKPLAARSPIGLTCAHFQRNGTYSWIRGYRRWTLPCYAVALIDIDRIICSSQGMLWLPFLALSSLKMLILETAENLIRVAHSSADKSEKLQGSHSQAS